MPPLTPDQIAQLKTMFDQALALHQSGKLSEAGKLYGQILKHQPNHFGALHYLGVLALQSGKAEQGAELIQKSIVINPQNPQAHSHLGNCLSGLNRNTEALTSFENAIAHQPSKPEHHYNRAFILGLLERPEEAVAGYDNAIKLKPDYAGAYNNRGNELRNLNHIDEAIASFDKAIGLSPGNADAYNNRGNALRSLERWDDALINYDKALELNPTDSGSHNNRGNVLCDLLRFKDAIGSYNIALAHAENKAHVNWNLSQCHLVLGNFDLGWPLYESRHQRPNAAPARIYKQPLWLGKEDISGKTLFVYWEQGFGDTFQFCRYIELLKERHINVVFQVEKPVLTLLKNLSSLAEIIGPNDPLPDFDFHCPLLSLPLAFKTDAKSVPANTPYLKADPEMIDQWATRLGMQEKKRIGLVWRGSPTHENDQNRSIDLFDLWPMLNEQAEFISLHVELKDAERDLIDQNNSMTHYGSEINDFNDTAALIDLMDLVITVDTSVAHLAGAMGKPVWVLLPYKPDWRWQLKRTDSPWYPSAKLFRQPELSDWRSVVEHMQQELSAYLSDKSLDI